MLTLHLVRNHGTRLFAEFHGIQPNSASCSTGGERREEVVIDDRRLISEQEKGREKKVMRNE